MWQTNKQTNKTISGDNIPYQWLSINCKESGYSPRFPLLHQQPYLFAFHFPFWPTCSLESVSCCLGHLAAIGCCNSTCFWLDAHNTRTYSMYVHTVYTYIYMYMYVYTVCMYMAQSMVLGTHTHTSTLVFSLCGKSAEISMTKFHDKTE